MQVVQLYAIQPTTYVWSAQPQTVAHAPIHLTRAPVMYVNVAPSLSAEHLFIA